MLNLDFTKEYSSDSLRLRLAAKTALSCAIAQIAGIMFDFTDPLWITFSAFLVSQLTISATVRKGLMRFAGTALGCLTGYTAGLAFSGHPVLIALVLSLFSGLMFYMGMKSRYQYAFMLAAFTPLVVNVMGDSAIGSTEVHALYRFIDIVMGICISWVVTLAVWPIDESREIMVHTHRLIKGILGISAAILDGRGGRDMERLMYRYRRFSRRIDSLFSSPVLPDSIKSESAGYLKIAAICNALYSHAVYFRTASGSSGRLKAERVLLDSDHVRRLRDMAADISSASDERAMDRLREEHQAIESTIELLKQDYAKTVLQSELDSGERERLFGLVHFVFFISRAILELCRDEPPDAPAVGLRTPGGGGFNLRSITDLRTFDRLTAIGAAKNALSVFLATVLWAIPFNSMQASIYSTIVNFNIFRNPSFRHFLYIFLGTVLGIAAGVAYSFIAVYTGYWSISLALFAIFLFSYITIGEEDWGYAGTFAGLSFIKCMYPLASSPAYVMDMSAMRAEAILFGMLCAMLVSKFLLPFDYRKQLENITGRLVSLFSKGIDGIEAASAGGGDHASLDKTWRDLRGAQLSYDRLIGEMRWDMFMIGRHDRKTMIGREEALDLYRNFSYLFLMVRYLNISNLGEGTTEYVRTELALLKRILKFVQTASSMGAATSGCAEGVEELVSREKRNIIAASSGGRLLPDIFLYRLSTLFSRLAALAARR